MAFISTTNPAFTGFGNLDEAIVESRYAAKRPLTLNGTVNKTAALLALCAASAAATWVQLLTGGPAAFGAVLGATKVAGIVAMVSALASMFKPLWSGVTGPVYALAKGVALAGVSAYAELMVPGIALNTVLLTLCTAGSLLFGLRSGLIRVTDQFGDAVRAATGGFFISMLAVLVMGMFGIRFPSLLTSGPLAIGVSLVSAGLAAANLLLDFDYVKQAAASRAVSEKLEWYMAQSTLFTLVWFYTSLLRLMMLLSGGRDD
ncbi:hypothetical protein MNEG_11146 [Monoraphidium neglectum]|uniref:Bax inhibitor-1/YccA family protein n=1 Tax=Monoraphidium neglectum TaxID=145388 RepID=A0A0D2M6G0_9CHLO|nr:hypothetical protein MNEG_11146 [Monoraphidium neglectum]KIY96816.1 hypothetical protein MNEG_11146 [Monoraphidium neglectum]|eukprot:XP_013895836.1 hypothetical protein MNEG_11146 [Monoraphidium neglectum]